MWHLLPTIYQVQKLTHNHKKRYGWCVGGRESGQFCHYHCFLTSNLSLHCRYWVSRTLHPYHLHIKDQEETTGAFPLMFRMQTDLHELREEDPSGATGWRQSLSRAPQLCSWENIGIEFSQMFVSLQFKNQVFIQQSSHTVGLWFIWLGYLPERNNLASSNSCDFSASLIKTPLFHYFLFSHTSHPH